MIIDIPQYQVNAVLGVRLKQLLKAAVGRFTARLAKLQGIQSEQPDSKRAVGVNFPAGEALA